MNIRNIDWRAKLRPLYRFATKLPPVVRSLAGLVLIGAGVLGVVMPILGSWMAPLGLLFIAADIPPLRRRVEAWLQIDGDGESVDRSAKYGDRPSDGHGHADDGAELDAAGHRIRPTDFQVGARPVTTSPAPSAERSA